MSQTVEREDGQMEIDGIDTPLGKALRDFVDSLDRIEREVINRNDLQAKVIELMEEEGLQKVKFEGRTITKVDSKPAKPHLRIRITRAEDSD